MVGYQDSRNPKNPFPFKMKEVYPLLKLTIRRTYPDSIDVDCFMCDKFKPGKLHIHFPTDSFHCNRCGHYGGMLELYANYYGISNSQALKEILNALNLDNSFKNIKKSQSAKSPVIKTNFDIFVSEFKKVAHTCNPQVWQETKETIKAFDNIAKRESIELYDKDTIRLTYRMNSSINESIKLPFTNQHIIDADRRHYTYSNLLSRLSLYPEHRESLLKRGFTDFAINQFQFKSVPLTNFSSIVSGLLESGCRLDNVAGFYQKYNDEWSINFNKELSGILIPYRGLDSRIQFFQIRLDNPREEAKYLSFTSIYKKSGTKALDAISLSGNLQTDEIYITEGALKGYVTNCLTQKTLLCNGGVTKTSGLIGVLPTLKKFGIKKIWIAFDMDLYTNKHVYKSCLKLLYFIEAFGFQVKVANWDQVNKGIDDHYWSLELKKKIINKLSQRINIESISSFTDQFVKIPIDSKTLVDIFYDRDINFVLQIINQKYDDFSNCLNLLRKDEKR